MRENPRRAASKSVVRGGRRLLRARIGRTRSSQPLLSGERRFQARRKSCINLPTRDRNSSLDGCFFRSKDLRLLKVKSRNGYARAVVLFDIELHAPPWHVPQFVRISFDYETLVRMTSFHLLHTLLHSLSHDIF